MVFTTVANGGDDVTVKLMMQTKGKIDNAANQDLSNLTDAGKQQVKDIAVLECNGCRRTR